MFLPLSLILDQFTLILNPLHIISSANCTFAILSVVQTDGDNTCEWHTLSVGILKIKYFMNIH